MPPIDSPVPLARLAASLACAVAATLAACGGGDVDPRLIPGGGVADPGIDGTLHVHAIDDDTGDPIEGATVHVGDREVRTDAAGLATITGVSGRQTVTVVAAGHVPVTWVGVGGANVTIPLDRAAGAAPPPVPQGTVTGTIQGWEGLTAPPGRALVAFTGYSLTHEDGDPANEIAQPDGNPPPNICVKLTPGASPCAWSLRTRTGRMAIYGFVGNLDGSQQLEITDFAYATGIEVDDRETLTGVTLQLAGAANLVSPGLTLASAPAGTDTVQALVVMDLGADGRLAFPQSSSLRVPVPTPAVLPGASYQVVAFASSESNPRAGAAVWQRDLSSVTSVQVGAFLPLPTGIQTDGSSFSFAAVPGASLHVLSVVDAGGDARWGVAVLDGSTSVTRPAAVTLPSGQLAFGATALEIPGIRLDDFEIDTISGKVARSSSDGVTFSAALR